MTTNEYPTNDRRRFTGTKGAVRGQWQSTGVEHHSPCGCVFFQSTKVGTRDYHERWDIRTRCPEHRP